MSLWTQTNDGYRTRMHLGQATAWRSGKRFIVVLAGTQSGKTSWGPLWLKREIDRCGSGDYLAVTASYDLFKLKMLPALRETFEHVYRIGRYWSGDRILELADPSGRFWAGRADDPMWGRIILRSAEAGGGLEATTAKGAWLDEAGQDTFTVETWEAVLRRLSLSQGRALLTTTIYNLGWLKAELHDPWLKSGKHDPNIDVIQFRSIDNPTFPYEEWERAKTSLPDWKFLMFYCGHYTRPAGLIYDSFKDFAVDGHGRPGHTCARFVIPADWQRYLGLDFGGTNTAGLFYAAEPGTKKLYLYREYKAGSRTAKEHAEALREGEPQNVFCVGGSASEGQWRREFRMGGLAVNEPDISDVEIGIQRVYGAHKRDEIIVFDDLAGYLDEKRRYSRKLDASGEPTLEIEAKSTFHYQDAERYIIGRIRRGE
jgi:hypothetical protein